MSSPPNVIVLGAGVSGLSTAYEFLQAYPGAVCTVVAETLPGDEANEHYASYWAGAAMAGCGIDPGMSDLMRDCSIATGKRCAELVAKYRDIPLAKARETDLFVNSRRAEGEESLKRAKSKAPNVKEVPSSGLPEDITTGYTFHGYSFDPPRYLLWLRRHLEASGVTFLKHKVSSIEEAATFDSRGRVDIIFNCTGTGSIDLADVKDTALSKKETYALIVKAPWLAGKTTVGYAEEGTQSAIARPGGTVHLGAANLQDARSPNRAQLVMEKSFKICPALLTKDSLDIVEQSTAYIPCRKTGLRVEREVKELKDGSSVIVIHNYGHCGNGYEMSFGRAQKAVQLTQTCF